MNKSLILKRIKEIYKFSNDTELANFLGIKSNRLSNWYARNSVDYDIIITKCENKNLNWILSGKEDETKEKDIDYIKSNDDFAEYINYLEKNNEISIEIINKLRTYALEFYKDAVAQKEQLLMEKMRYERFKELVDEQLSKLKG